jgi:outer membrane lipoprotein SlyB
MKFSLFLVFALGLVAAGCTSTTENTKEKAVLGGLGGAVIGGVIGHQSGKGLEGAAVGAAAGAAAGGVWGSAQDERASQPERR